MISRRALVFLWCGLAGCDAAPPVPQAPSASQAPSVAQAPSPPAGLPKVDVGPEAVDAIVEYTGGAQAVDKVPVVVAIHGLGDRPDAFRGLFQGFPGRARFVFPAGGLPWGGGFAWWPISGKIDENSMAPGLYAASERLAKALSKWSSGAAGKPIVTGFSQGGMLSYTLAVRHPEALSEAVPISGLVPPKLVPSEWPAGAPRPRIFGLHGEADERVPFAYAKSGADRLRALGLDVDFRSYPGVGHTISADMRRDLFEALSAAVERALRTKTPP